MELTLKKKTPRRKKQPELQTIVHLLTGSAAPCGATIDGTGISNALGDMPAQAFGALDGVTCLVCLRSLPALEREAIAKLVETTPAVTLRKDLAALIRAQGLVADTEEVLLQKRLEARTANIAGGFAANCEHEPRCSAEGSACHCGGRKVCNGDYPECTVCG